MYHISCVPCIMCTRHHPRPAFHLRICTTVPIFRRRSTALRDSYLILVHDRISKNDTLNQGRPISSRPDCIIITIIISSRTTKMYIAVQLVPRKVSGDRRSKARHYTKRIASSARGTDGVQGSPIQSSTLTRSLHST